MATILIDGQEIEIGDDERLNGIEAARRAGVEIPHYCWHPGLSVVASCRMCLVEAGSRDAETGDITMVPKLVPACQTPARNGTVLVTASEKVRRARAMVEEDLLLRHPTDCPICDKAGECHLQDYHFQYGQGSRRADIRPFTSRRRTLGETVTLFVDRCVMCSRCVRFTREITGSSELMISSRGSHEEIDVFPGFPLANKMSGNVVDLCPVGALGDRQFLYTQRVWFMKSHDGICTGCSSGCNIHIDENQDHIYRLRPRENRHVNQWWMCDEGRYGFHHVHSTSRLVEPLRRDGDTDQSQPIDWHEVIDAIDRRLRAAEGRIAAVLSPHLTVEAAYLLARYVRDIDPQAVVAMGPVPRRGEDERFASNFTIRAEKCPNRRGIEAIVAHFMDGVASWNDLLEQCQREPFAAAWITGGTSDDWISEDEACRFEGIGILVVHDTFASPLWQRADFGLPAATFAERDGCYVNHADRLQSARWAVRPPSGVQAEGPVMWRMLGRDGLFQSQLVLAELAAEIPYFSAASAGVPTTGIDLKMNLVSVRS
ncbi:MAG: molybdopterin-dependent oxidoreductase [Pirellulales bacterium]